MLEEFMAYGIIFGIPLIFFGLLANNVIKIIIKKREKEIVERKLITFTIIFGVIFLSIMIFYTWIVYTLTNSVAMM